MNQIFNEIVLDMSSLWESIDFKKLRNNTRKCPRNFYGSIAWEQIEHLHILGSNNSNQMLDVRGGLEPGAYINAEHTWLLIIGLTAKRIFNCIKACGPALELLDIRFTDIERIDLSHLHQLSVLNLSFNEKLLRVNGLGHLTNLSELDLDRTNLWGPLDLRNHERLSILNVSSSMISHILIDRTMPYLRQLNVSNTRISNTEFLYYMPNLQMLDISDTDISQVPELSLLPELRGLDLSWTNVNAVSGLASLTELEYLNLSYTRIIDLEDQIFPINLRYLLLAATPMPYLPEGIRRLKQLRRLDLSHMVLSDLPSWLTELGLRLNSSRSYGIILNGTTVKNVDSSILSQSHELISQWLEMRDSQNDSVPLNELKIVFLGDGEAGKSHTIARLLNDGGFPLGYDGTVTPGIAIYNKQYSIEGRSINVHYWDFGGQEILHSMHRIFMTQRTLYVVLINARDNTQDERARYWLHNIGSFAKGSRVLMVLNKIDQNPNASINETELRFRYSNLSNVVKLSALKASQEEFNRTFTSVLLKEIASIDTPKSLFPRSWLRIKNMVQNMDDVYLSQTAFKNLCMMHNVQQPEIIESLRDWFTDLGVSFCYHKHGCSEDYVVLRPDWITNAIYIILFNKRDSRINGIISHRAIHSLLGSHNDDIKRVLPDITYDINETKFVISVIRQFQLSYQLEDGLEFMPMLCQRNSPPIAMEYASDPRTMEFRMIYDYLPNNVIHRLMVDRRAELDTENVWLTGARFCQDKKTELSQDKKTGLSAVVRIDGNILKINVRSDRGSTPSHYLDLIRKDVEEISNDLSLKIKERQLAYKNAGSVEYFDYDELTGSLQCGIRDFYSKKHRKLIKIRDILDQTNSEDTEAKNRLVQNLQFIARSMQETKMYWDAHEEARNTYFRDFLQAMGYIVSDQSLTGSSSNVPYAGELDLDIRKECNVPWTILDALTIRGISPAYLQHWNDHLTALLTNYNPFGLRFLFQLCYVTCTREKYIQVMRYFGNHLKNFAPPGFVLDGEPQIQSDEINANMHVFCCRYKSSNQYAEIFHLFMRIGD